MGLLEKLWDETLAGPTPEAGLGKLRKHNSFSGAPPTKITNLTVSVDSSCSSTAPKSPFSPNNTTPAAAADGGNLNKLSRRKSAAAALPKSPTGYDWIVLSALDR